MKNKFFCTISMLILVGCNALPAGEIPSMTPAQTVLPIVSATVAIPTEPPIPGITLSPEETPQSPSVTPTSQFLTDSVTLENLYSVPPEDIIEEVSYFASGTSGSGCYDWRFRSPSIFPELPQSLELVPLEEFRTIQVSLCGVVPGESIKLLVRHQGTNTVVMQEEMTAQSIPEQTRGYVDFSPYTIPFDGPTGDYVFSVSGSDWSLEHRLKVEESHHTRLLLLDSTLYFYNFMPDEIIKLLVYTTLDNPRLWKFVGWNQVKMTQDGSLRLTTDVEIKTKIGYVALRDNFETIPSVRPDDDGLFGLNTFSCNGAPHQSGIGPGKPAMVVSDYKSDPEYSDAPLIQIGKIVYIYTGPFCKNARFYWTVMCLEGSCFGDIPEGGPEGFYLQPVDLDYLTQISPPTPTQVIDTVNPIDKAHVINIQQGSFEMGLNQDQYNKLLELGGLKELLDASQPAHTVTLDSYKIYKTEVSNLMYSLCVADGVCTPPLSYSSETHNSYFRNPDYADYPVVFVTWYMAQNYCQWAGGRLPTEAEWEYAARSSNANLFPWGEQIFNYEEYANVEWRYSDTTSVHSLPLGASPFGLLNMTGNVWEWVYDWYRDDYYATNFSWDNPIGPESGDYLNGELKTGKGGSYWISFANSSPAIRDWYQANQAGSAVGFRCVIER